MDEGYSPTPLVYFLHGFPHLSFSFILLKNQSFTFESSEYFESLTMIALMPIAMSVLTMMGFLLYYCCVRMKRAAPNKTNSTSCYCSVCLIIVFVMLALGSICVAIYGSIQVHEGLTSSAEALSDINHSVSKITGEVSSVSNLLGSLQSNAKELKKSLPNNSVSEMMYHSTQSLRLSMKNFPHKNNQSDDKLLMAIEVFEQTEYYRTIVTFSLIGLHGLVCLLAVIGICFHSKGILISTTFIGLICLVITYLYIGSLLMVDVAAGDLCMNPFSFIISQSVESNDIDNATAVYYQKCLHEVNAEDFYENGIKDAHSFLNQINKGIRNIDTNEKNLPPSTDLLLDQLHTKSHEFLAMLKSLQILLNCKKVHEALAEKLVPAVCDFTIEGLFILGIAMLCVCFALTSLLCAAPKSWKRFSKKPTTRDDLDLDDVFLPASNTRSVVSRTNNPLYNPPEQRYSRRISSVNANAPSGPVPTNTLSFFRQSEEDLTLLDQPPPDYSPPRPGSNY